LDEFLPSELTTSPHAVEIGGAARFVREAAGAGAAFETQIKHKERSWKRSDSFFMLAERKYVIIETNSDTLKERKERLNGAPVGSSRPYKYDLLFLEGIPSINLQGVSTSIVRRVRDWRLDGCRGQKKVIWRSGPWSSLEQPQLSLKNGPRSGSGGFETKKPAKFCIADWKRLGSEGCAPTLPHKRQPERVTTSWAPCGAHQQDGFLEAMQ
jgi:hypothetical protein